MKNHRNTRRGPSGLFGAVLLLFGCGQANAQSNVQQLPSDLETELALSAAPPHLRENASVYLLDPAVGLVSSRAGTNGFTCFVGRTPIYDLPRVRELRDDILIPICYDRVGTESIFPVWLYAEEQRARGMSAVDLVSNIDQRAVAPPRSGVAPMISPLLRAYTPTGEPFSFNLPHYMYYAPNISADELGTQMSMRDPFPQNYDVYGGRHVYMIQVLGVSEIAAITAEYAGMLERLCQIRADRAWCLD